MRTIRIKFTDFWHAGTPDEVRAKNPIYNLLADRYDLVLSDDPDFVLYSCFGHDFLKHSCVRIFYAGENVRANYNECDYAFTFDFSDHPRHYRLPLYGLYPELDAAVRPVDVDQVMSEDRGFCSFVYSNGNAAERIEFFRALSEYRPIASGGAVLNNVGGPVEDKIAFARDYKFAIAFENTSHPGYTTEKLLHAFVSGAVPIYWGNPLAAKDFNPRAFINCHDFDDFNAVVEHVARVDSDDELYRAYLSEPCFEDNVLNSFVDPAKILERFDQIFERPVSVPVARTWRGRLRHCWRRGSAWSRGLGSGVIPRLRPLPPSS